jgi:hypothetical protein
MKEISGDLWQYHQQGLVVAITTGGLLEKGGFCAMPRGCARQAKDRFAGLAWTLGQQILMHGNHVFDLGQKIVSFPVEESPFEVPDIRLIERSCRELVELTDYKGWQQVVVPRPGCGGGGLSWQDVKPKLDTIFDDRFLVISQSE